MKIAAFSMKLAGGLAFSVVAVLWIGVLTDRVGEFDYLYWGFITAAVYFAGRLLGYALKFFEPGDPRDALPS